MMATINNVYDETIKVQVSPSVNDSALWIVHSIKSVSDVVILRSACLPDQLSQE